MAEEKFTDEHIGYIVLGLVLTSLAVGSAWYLGAFSALLGDEADGPESLIEPITFDVSQFNMDKVLLGRRLYHDGILSGDGSVSCASCHGIEDGGAEARRVSIGVAGAPGPINAPTVLNSGFNFVQFWDGRAKDLHEQAGGPMTNPIEMHSNFTLITERLEADPWYKEHFASVYPEQGITEETITEAVAHYEDSLQTPSPFDAWLKGDATAVDEQVLRGHKTFQEVGCTTCHNGINVGGNSFQKMGLVKDYFAERGGEITEADLGRYNVTKDESDKHKFKVPTLRNITLTAPYFHDGSTWEVDEAVRTMARVQLGRELRDEQVEDIVAFLGSLKGELPEHAVLPEAQRPPERQYDLVPDYDVRFVYEGEQADPQLKVIGTVADEEQKAALESAVRRDFRRVDLSGVTVADYGKAVSGAAQACMSAAAGMLSKLERGRFDIALAEDDSKLRFAGEGLSEAVGEVKTAFTALPEGCSAWKDLTVYESAVAEQCDERLAAIQGTSKLSFRSGSAELTEPAQGQLRDVSKALEGCPEGIRLRIDGHTDDSGDANQNIRLSRARAFAVRDLLMRLGIDPARMIARGFGASRPLRTNDSEEGRAANRRIELRLDRPGISLWSPVEQSNQQPIEESTSTSATSEGETAQGVAGGRQAAGGTQAARSDAPAEPVVPPKPRPAAEPQQPKVEPQGRASDAGSKRSRPKLDAAVPQRPRSPESPTLPPPRDMPTPTTPGQ